MKRWSYAINNHYKTAILSRESAPWHIFLIERLAGFVCNVFPAIPLPKIKFRLKDKEEIIDNGGKWTTLKEQYGSLDHVFHLYVHVPIYDFCWKRIETKDIKIDYYKLKGLVYDEDREFWG